MYLFHIILKLLENMHLVTSSELQQLTVDVHDWEKTATIDNKDSKLKSLYGKLHQGIAFRLISPFIYVGLVSWVKGLLSDNDNDNLQTLS